MEFITIIIPLFVLVVIYFFLRELKSWYKKINERITLMEKHNTLLWSLILGANTNDEIKKEISLMRQQENPLKNEHSPSIAQNDVKVATNTTNITWQNSVTL